jgi:hypothetical protein
MHDVFISYAREDCDTARRLCHDLKGHRIEVWIDSESLRPGEKWKQAISTAIRESTFFIALLSSRSLSKRGYIQKELNLALEIAKELPYGSIFIIPIRLDDCHPADPRLQEYQYIDLFPSYDGALVRLADSLTIRTASTEEQKPKKPLHQTELTTRFCPLCGSVIRAFDRHCALCGSDVGFPNVRWAQQHRSGLEERYRFAMQRARVYGSESRVKAFERMVEGAAVVITMQLATILHLLASDNSLYSTVASRVLEQEIPRTDKPNGRADTFAKNQFFPHYSRELVFGVLSPDGRGVWQFGNVSVRLRSSTIQHRATVFETNSYLLAARQLTEPDLASGFVSTLSEKNLLAVSKCAHLINADTTDQELGDLLLPIDQSRRAWDCMEVQIYGPIHRLSIEEIRVHGVDITDPTNSLMLDVIGRKAQEAGISLYLD